MISDLATFTTAVTVERSLALRRAERLAPLFEEAKRHPESQEKDAARPSVAAAAHQSLVSRGMHWIGRLVGLRAASVPSA